MDGKDSGQIKPIIISDMPMTNASPSRLGVQHAIILAMDDLVLNNDDTLWLTENETVFERLTDLYLLAGGDKDLLAEKWPECFRK